MKGTIIACVKCIWIKAIICQSGKRVAHHLSVLTNGREPKEEKGVEGGWNNAIDFKSNIFHLVAPCSLSDTFGMYWRSAKDGRRDKEGVMKCKKKTSPASFALKAIKTTLTTVRHPSHCGFLRSRSTQNIGPRRRNSSSALLVTSHSSHSFNFQRINWTFWKPFVIK